MLRQKLVNKKDEKGSNKETCNRWKEILDKFEITTLQKLTIV